MGRALLTLAGLLALALPAQAADGGIQVSLGYSFVKYLEQDAGSAPLGAHVSLAGRKTVAPELDLGWQQDKEGDVTLDTFTATAGPRFVLGSGDAAKPFIHVLGGLRHDRIEDFNPNTAWGGQAGGGVDIRIGERSAIRLGADFQIFFDQGENLKTLRLSAGFTF
jgi:hypothetical protein